MIVYVDFQNGYSTTAALSDEAKTSASNFTTNKVNLKLDQKLSLVNYQIRISNLSPLNVGFV